LTQEEFAVLFFGYALWCSSLSQAFLFEHLFIYCLFFLPQSSVFHTYINSVENPRSIKDRSSLFYSRSGSTESVVINHFYA